MATSVVNELVLWNDTSALTVKSASTTGAAYLRAGVLAVNGSVVNVASYGAVGDGSTDATLAIQSAIDALGTTGGVITGPMGTYLVSKTAQIAHDSLTTGYCLIVNADATHGPIVFDFPRGTVFKLAASQAKNSAIILINGASVGYRIVPTTIRGITFNGNYLTQTAWDDHGLVTVIYAYDVVIDECQFNNFWYAGIHILRDSRGTKVLNCVLDGTIADGVVTVAEGTGACARIEVQDLLFQGNRSVVDALNGRGHMAIGDNADAFLMGQGMRIIGNAFSGGFNGNGIELGGVGYCLVANNVFRDFCDTSGWALAIKHYLNANGTVYDALFNIVRDNVFFNVRQGIQLAGTDASMTANAATVIYTVGAVGNSVSGNVFTMDPVDLRTQIGIANTYPDRFGSAPNAAAVNLVTGIQLAGTSLLADTATGGGAATLTDTKQAMGTTQYVNKILVITGGTGKGQVRKIASHTATVFTVAVANWDVTPDATSTYVVTRLVGYNKIFGNIIHATNNTTKGIEDTCFLPNEIYDNTVYNSNTAGVNYAITNPNAIMRGNKAFANSIMGGAPATHPVYQDENSGTASILTATTAIVVTHKLGRTPAASQVMVWPITTNGSATEWWVDTITATTFTINVDINPAATYSFGWRVFGSA